MVLGVRGIPNVKEGVEVHAVQLYTRLARMGCEVEVIVRSPYVSADQLQLGPIRPTRIWSPTHPGFEALCHSLLGVLYAGFRRPDILHIHAVGPAAVTPLARLKGLRVVVTHHGPDNGRDRWGWFARGLLRFGESAGMRFPNAWIVISRVIADLVRRKHRRQSVLIPNGVVAASAAARPGDWKLALVGGLGTDEYSRQVREAASAEGVVLTGFLGGVAFRQLYSHGCRRARGGSGSVATLGREQVRLGQDRRADPGGLPGRGGKVA
jgi:hypothetical protein